LRVLAQRIFLEGPEELGNDLYLFRDNIWKVERQINQNLLS
jgi:hypothetical protein